MKENKYDNENFFIKYSQMERSKKGPSLEVITMFFRTSF